MKKSYQICFALLVWFLCTGLSLSPETWIKDISKQFGRDTPKYQNIKFWDANLGEERGIRAVCYTVLNEPKNRLVDQRLYFKLAQLLDYVCDDVLTIESFEGTTQMMVERMLHEMVDLWKQQGKVDPERMFTIPVLDCDVLVLMERTHYDQVWNKDEKKLLIGLNVALFEMDFGEPLYMNHVLAEVPWFGENASFMKAEHSAILKVVDEMGRQLQKAADFINDAHDEEVRLAAKEQRVEEREQSRKLKAEEREFIDQTRQLERFLRDNDEPAELITQMSAHLEAMQESLVKRGDEVSPDEWNRRRQLLSSVQDLFEQHGQWLKEQEEMKRQEEISEPPKENLPSLENPLQNVQFPEVSSQTTSPQQAITIPESMVPLPSVDVNPDNISDKRQWIIPSNPSESFSNQSRNPQPQTGGSEVFTGGNQVQENPMPQAQGFPQAATGEMQAPQEEQQPIIPLDINKEYREMLKARAQMRNSTASGAQINPAT